MVAMSSEILRVEEDELVRSLVRGLGSAAVAFSGGVDSSVVLALAVEELGRDRVLAVTAASETYSQSELVEARLIAESLGVRHLVLKTSELELPGFSQNPPDRCLHCKRELFGKIRALADRDDLSAVVDGANADDRLDYRPGLRAAAEFEVRHPLMEAGLGKEAVRALALRLGLDNWGKPALACLASRVPYGEEITVEKLQMVARAEAWLREQGFSQVRVRHHQATARIEVPPAEIGLLLEEEKRGEVVEALKQVGYTYVTLDLQGFRSGSMNEVLADNERER
jgi:uncharacterized protein